MWTLVAEYLLRRNPKCRQTKRAGSIAACVSKIHKESVDIALRVNACRFASACSRPILIQYNNRDFNFCMDCPFNFECDDPDEVDIKMGTKICSCVEKGDIVNKNVRSTICLFKTSWPCPSCNYGYSNTAIQMQVRRLVHKKDIGPFDECLESCPPRICMDCGFTSLIE
jgi:hypothetical protein